MTKPIPASHVDLLERPLIASLATTLPDGTPQVTAVWFNFADGLLYVNTAVGRLKDRAVRKTPYVALMVVDPADMYRYIQVRGPVVEMNEAEGAAHINFLSHRYDGKDYNLPAGQQRVRYAIRPEKVDAHG
jgi:PPOX class probable F420-dependent enzyme